MLVINIYHMAPYPFYAGGIDSWLDNTFNQIEYFEPLLHPNIPQNLIAQKIDKPITYNTVGSCELLICD